MRFKIFYPAPALELNTTKFPSVEQAPEII
ncbi:hypothetical protein X474_00530 [Dethiosulfatarculus sandiegensis]|uniref:Uncharacterized protein n=1 Tax=Dethiosulfatarculus sandiegensis TaxID=1429043 RepID=A0A0D2K3C1_9BACT|nr:hypothetical protein X474_00530 [Dethiosulfatarculus sandiegensis]